MRILFVSQWFDPEPTFKGLLFAQELQRHGHVVEVLTGFPNYPGGKLYPGYRVRIRQRETSGGISVLRVPLYPSHSRSAIGRILNYASFALSAAIAALTLRRPDVVYLYHPPGTAALPAIVLKWTRRVPFVLDIQDMWPDTLAATGMLSNRPMLAAVGRWMGFVYRRAAHIVVLSSGFRRLLIERGVPAEKVSVIPNWTHEWPEAAEVPAERARELGFAGRFNVVFAGTMGTAQALETVIEAAELVRERAPDMRFVLIGGGVDVERLQALAAAKSLDNLVFLPRRPPDEMPEILALADALLVQLRDDPLFEVTIPSKTQAYLSAGRPILIGVRGDAAKMVEEAGAGLAFAPEDPAALAEAALTLAALPEIERERMGAAGRSYYHDRLALPVGASRFASLFEQVAERGGRRSR